MVVRWPAEVLCTGRGQTPTRGGRLGRPKGRPRGHSEGAFHIGCHVTSGPPLCLLSNVDSRAFGGWHWRRYTASVVSKPRAPVLVGQARSCCDNRLHAVQLCPAPRRAQGRSRLGGSAVRAALISGLHGGDSPQQGGSSPGDEKLQVGVDSHHFRSQPAGQSCPRDPS